MNGKVDWKFASAAVGDDPELLRELVEIYFEEYPKLVAGIQSTLESQAYVELRRFAHTLKGCLRYFGKTRAGDLSGQLEIMARDQQIEGATKLFAELQIELAALLPELKAFAASPSSDTDA